MNSPSTITINGITLAAPRVPRQNEVFTADTLTFLASLHAEFGARAAAVGETTGSTPTVTNGVAPAPKSAEAVEKSWRALVDKHLAEPACTFIAPRRLGREEGRILCRGESISAGMADFGLHISRNARRLLSEGRAPFISLLGLESEEELELWQDLFVRAEELLDLPEGTIRAIQLADGETDGETDGDDDGGDDDAGHDAAVVLTERDRSNLPGGATASSEPRTRLAA